MIRIFNSVLVALILSSCSSIKSIESPKVDSGNGDGLTYFMPKKDFLITITIKDKKVTEVALGTTAAYPDLSKQYVLRHDGNFFGKNTLDVGVNKTGLLSSTKSTTVSNVTDAFKNLATAAGELSSILTPMVIAPNGENDDSKCTTDGEHTFIFNYKNPPETKTICGVQIDIKKVTSSISCATTDKDCNKGNENILSHSKTKNKEYSGIFYRRSEPYLITTVNEGINVAAIVFSPSQSATHFLPVSKTFFSNNEADFAFVDGMLTKYKQETEGEAVALFKLPADILSSYFSAIGSIFDSFKTTDQKEAEALAESLKLELAKKKYDACITAIKAGDDKLTKELGCQ